MQEAVKLLTLLKSRGRNLVGCFPLYPPLELLHSFGLTPVTLWGLEPDTLARSDKHLQNYTCQVARSLTELVLGEAGRLFDAFLMYNACDTLRNLPEIIREGLKAEGLTPPVFRLHVPAVSPERTGARTYLKARLAELVGDLEKFTGHAFSPEGFRHSASLYRRQRGLSLEMENLVRSGSLSFAACAEVLGHGHFLPVEDHIELLEKELSSAPEASPQGRSGAPVLVSGIRIPPAALIRTMEESGLCVAANDLAMLGRSYGYSPGPDDDPGKYYCDFYFNRYPCTTMLPAGDRRISHIRQTVHAQGVKGVIFFAEKFCEYEYFEIPYLENMLKEEGVSTLCLEMGTDEAESLGALKNRIEAFAEMLLAGA